MATVAGRLRQEPGAEGACFTGFSDRLFDEKGAMWEDKYLEKPCGPRAAGAVSLLRNRNRSIGDIYLDRKHVTPPITGGQIEHPAGR